VLSELNLHTLQHSGTTTAITITTHHYINNYYYYFWNMQAASGSKRIVRCAVAGCNDRAARIVGDCRYCQAKHCSRHRLPEAHACAKLNDVQKDSFARNADRLLGEKCVASKV